MNSESLKSKFPRYQNFLKDLLEFYDFKKQIARQNFENCVEALGNDETLNLLL